MRATSVFSLLVATVGTHVSAQTSSTSSAAPSTTITPEGPVTGKLGNATVVSNNPAGVVYKAAFPEAPFFKAAYPDGGNLKGAVIATANPDGKGVLFKLKLSNLPKSGGPFIYHLHVNPVPENGNCTATLAHQDPFVRGEDPVCDKNLPETCQVGDLSGKYGAIPEGKDTFEANYLDLYASTHEGIGAFFGNRSIVFHYANKTRVSCANFELVADGGGVPLPSAETSVCSTSIHPHPTGANATRTTTTILSTGAVTSSTSAPTPPSASTVPIAAGTSVRVGGAGVIAFAAAIMFML